MNISRIVTPKIVHLVLLTVLFFALPITSAPGEESLTLERAIEISLKNNYAILIAENDAEIATNNASLGNAGFLPTLDMNGSASKTIFDTKQEYASG